MKISAIVIVFNEEKYLERCLEQLVVCDQLIVVDLGSDDRSPEIAKQFATDYITHQWEPVVEYVLPDILEYVVNDWVIWADPDEIFSEQLLKEIGDITSKTNNFAKIGIPFQYYFLAKPLKKSVWGGTRYFDKKIFNVHRVHLFKNMDKAIEVCEPYTIGKIEWTETNVVKHYWVDSYSELFQKHHRYLSKKASPGIIEGKKHQ
ncbi:MAG: glycosyltransferase [Anaerolineaceae bacterium]|nr:glycosyltransferase [Anaerolineaceae bacterium]